MKIVMVVVEKETLRRTLSANLVAYGYNIIQVKNGLEGMAAIQALGDEIRLIIVDIQMPRIDGIMLINFIKQADYLARSVYISANYKNISLGVRADACLVKPYSLTDLLDVVQKLSETSEIMELKTTGWNAAVGIAGQDVD